MIGDWSLLPLSIFVFVAIGLPLGFSLNQLLLQSNTRQQMRRLVGMNWTYLTELNCIH